MKSPFLMDMKNREFKSIGFLAIRQWFERMVSQFEGRAKQNGLDWNSAEMFIVMHPDAWDYVAHLYTPYKLGESALFSEHEQRQRRHEEYLTRRALPINGRWYQVVLDSQIPATNQEKGICSDIFFITTRIGGETIIIGQYQDLKQLPDKPCLSGIIQNVCTKENSGLYN